MLPSSQTIAIPLRQPDELIDLSELNISLDQRMLALEAEIDALQRLVCYLLEKNERLRIRCKSL